VVYFAAFPASGAISGLLRAILSGVSNAVFVNIFPTGGIFASGSPNGSHFGKALFGDRSF
jgi:hypothetical protein